MKKHQYWKIITLFNAFQNTANSMLIVTYIIKLSHFNVTYSNICQQKTQKGAHFTVIRDTYFVRHFQSLTCNNIGSNKYIVITLTVMWSVTHYRSFKSIFQHPMMILIIKPLMLQADHMAMVVVAAVRVQRNTPPRSRCYWLWLMCLEKKTLLFKTSVVSWSAFEKNIIVFTVTTYRGK